MKRHSRWRPVLKNFLHLNFSQYYSRKTGGSGSLRPSAQATKEKLRLLEECSFVPPRDFVELRRYIEVGKDAMGLAIRDLHAFREQPDWSLRWEAKAKTAEPAAARIFGEVLAAGALGS